MRLKIHSRIIWIVMLLLFTSFCLLMVGCSKEAAQTEDEEDIAEESIYGDESLGIDAVVGEKLRDYRSVLIAGIDNGNRTDMMIVLCMNEKSGDTRMFSVTRDAYMQIADGETVNLDDREYEFCKCNRAYEFGGKYALMKEFNRHLDLNIREFIGIDWECAAKLIDALGGIECDIASQDMLNAINDLINNSAIGDHQPIESTGVQTLSGWQAVHFLRVRKYDGGSAIAREERSRAVVAEMISKAKEMTVEDISDIYDEIADDLDTNMSRSTLTETLTSIGTAEINDQGGWPYEYEEWWDQDEHFVYAVPETLYSNVKELHAAVFDQEEYSTSNTVQQLDERITELEKNTLKQID